jgi:sulfhydrogenase subunit delta
MTKKLRVGWFTFTCCEDSTIIFTEMLNDHYREWKEKIHFVHAKVLQEKNEWEPMDVAFVEGAITTKSQEDKLKKIRGLATKLVAIGACACTGMPSAQRNHFDAATKAEIQALLSAFDQSEMVKTIEQIVPVDAKVQGCPMTEMMFLKVLNSSLSEFAVA